MKYAVLPNRKCLVEIYDECKYTYDGDESLKMKYDDVESWEVLSGTEAEAFEKTIDEECIDDYHEYLILYRKDGSTASFRNSYVDLFILH